MTMVLKSANPSHRSRYFDFIHPTICPFDIFITIIRSIGEEGLYVLDASTLECLQYESLYPKKRKLKLKLETFDEHHEIQVRNDLIDCQIDICSVDVR